MVEVGEQGITPGMSGPAQALWCHLSTEVLLQRIVALPGLGLGYRCIEHNQPNAFPIPAVLLHNKDDN